MIRKYFSLLLLSGMTFGCGVKNAHQEEANTGTYVIRYAQGFEVNKKKEYTEVKIRNPWDTTRYLQHYILIPSKNEMPDNLPQGTVIRTPVRKTVAYASSHCGVLNELDVIDHVVGVCESRFIDIPYIQQSVKAGTIIDLGEASAPDVEKLIELAPDVIMTSPFQNMGYGRVSKTGIPIIECADYMEASPLARAEWIRFHGLFYETEKRADSLFNITVERYNALKERTAVLTEKPSVFSEKKNGASWFVPGGNSYMACFYKDAGADYIWRGNPSSGSVPLAFEEVFDKAGSAKFWLLKHNDKQTLTYEALKQDFRLYAEFESFKNKNIFICNTGIKPFYEEMPLHPDRVLEDFVWIFHPELMPGYTPRYFQKMED